MNEPAYTVGPDEKATQVMIGTADTLLWGSLVTKESVRISVFLNTLAEEFVPLHDTKVLFLAPSQQVTPIERPSLHIKLEEILTFFAMNDPEPLPEETETRHYVPIEALVGSYQIEGKILKPPMSTLQNMLLVSRALYLPIYEATMRHVAKPWLGTLTAQLVQVQRDRLIIAAR
jgi:hypothetical protein